MLNDSGPGRVLTGVEVGAVLSARRAVDGGHERVEGALCFAGAGEDSEVGIRLGTGSPRPPPAHGSLGALLDP
eukprot:10335404-Lingulodinium_polyedra.AAC.1